MAIKKRLLATNGIDANNITIANVAAPAAASDAATKSYVDQLVVGLINDRGAYDASANSFPASGGSGAAGAIKKGDLWYVSVAGTLGGSAVNVGDSFRALTDAPGQTAANWSMMESNLGFVPYAASNPSGFTSNLGTVTAVTASLPLASTGGDTPNISMPAAAAAQDGYMTAVHAAKLDNVSGTNTGDNAINTRYESLQTNAVHTGDVSGGTELTLATVNSTVGSFGSSTKIPVVTVNAKGLVTSVVEQDVEGTVTNNMTLINGDVSSFSFTADASADQTITTIVGASFKSAKFTIQVFSGTEVQVSEILLAHNGTAVSMVEYAVVTTGASLAAFDAAMSSGNVELKITPTGAGYVVKGIVSAVNA